LQKTVMASETEILPWPLPFHQSQYHEPVPSMTSG